jgi:hypothetical protein
MSWQIQERVNLGHTDSLWTVSSFYNVVACTNFSLLQYAKVKPWSPVCYEKRRHTRFIHADADAVACYAWLCHFKYRVTNAVSIANAYLVIRESLNREVFSELAEDEVAACEDAFPVAIGVDLINQNGSLLPTMTDEIALRIANNIELARHSSVLHWGFPDRGTDHLTVPRHVAWKTDIE